jgi:Holliday junction DNA helicase RuvA
MIGRLRGKLTRLRPGEVIIDAGGVGYLVRLSYNSFYQLPEDGEEATLLIHTYVREDTLALYGFSGMLEKELFLRLIGVSGIGPRLAINILSGIPSVELVEAVNSASVERLQAIPGVGKKTAERIVIEMRDKLKSLITDEMTRGEGIAVFSASPIQNDVVSALLNLGYKRKEAETAFSAASRELGSDAEFQNILKKCLAHLSGGFLK